MKKWTVIFIAVMVVAIAVYDVIAIVFGGTEASISSHFIIWAYKYPLFPYSMGILTGHLFWRMKANKDTRKLGI